MDERIALPREPMYYNVNIPADVSMGRIISKPLLVSERLIPELWGIVVRNSREAGRTFVERPYVIEDGGHRSDAMTAMTTRVLLEDMAALAQKHKLSIVSHSPVRWSGSADATRYGRAFIEFTHVPLTPWKD